MNKFQVKEQYKNYDLFFEDEEEEVACLIIPVEIPCKIENIYPFTKQNKLFAKLEISNKQNNKCRKFDFEQQSDDLYRFQGRSTDSRASTIRKQSNFRQLDHSGFSDFSYQEDYRAYEKDGQLDQSNQITRIKKQENLGNTKNKGKRIRGEKRKVRTTITTEKLQKLNELFEVYFDQKNRGLKPELSLKKIAEMVNLSHSTTLHKSSIFRNNKVVKPGKFLSSLTKKRKYKKSEKCQEYISIALLERPFYSAEALAKYIYRRWRVSYPRAVIGRHLNEMGYSSNNIKASPIERNGTKCVSIRRQYANILHKIMEYPYLHIYVDQVAFSKNLFRSKTTYTPCELRKQMQETEKDYVSMMVAMTSERVVYYSIKQGFYNKSDFVEAIDQIHQNAYSGFNPNGFDRILLLNDVHKIHYDSSSTSKGTQKISVEAKLRKLGIKRIFLPPGSPQLNPVENMVSYLKNILLNTKTKDEIKDCQTLKQKINFNMKNDIAKEPTDRFFFEFNKWFKKALNEQAF